MMHATLPAPQLSPAAVALNGAARAVALYASDMPDRARFSTVGEAQAVAWIAQGIERLGLEKVREGGEFLRSFNLAMANFEDTREDHRAFRLRFPSKRRINSAQDTAAMLTMIQGERASAQRAKVIPFPYTVQSAAELVSEGWMAA